MRVCNEHERNNDKQPRRKAKAAGCCCCSAKRTVYHSVSVVGKTTAQLHREVFVKCIMSHRCDASNK